MKIRNLVLGMMTCAAFTACTNDDIVDNNDGGSKLKGEAYVAIDIIAPASTNTRAAGDGFDAGTNAENKVNNAIFLFFDASGNSCNEAVEVAGTEFDGKWTAGSGSIANISTPVLVLNPVNGVIPTSVIAVLNATKAELNGKSLAAVKAIVGQAGSYAKNPGLTMSNSAYLDGANKAVIEVPLTIDNLAISAPEALKHPVVIPVERIVAKASIAAESALASNEQTVTIDGKEVKVKTVVKGWKVTCTNPDSYLLKNITGLETFGDFAWNDAANKRSYWAKSVVPAADYKHYSYDQAIATTASDYCFENTSDPYTGNNITTSKLWVIAQIQKTDGTPLSIMEWRGSKTTPDGVKKVMASQLQKYYYKKADNTYETILPAHLAFTEGAEHYKAKATLATDAPATFYTISGTTATDATTALKADIDKMPEALAWTDGMTYYYTNIQHSGTVNGGVNGIVRNHIYQIKISSIGGLGTPVFDPKTEIIPTKPTPTEASYVAAQVEILKWKVVTNEVALN